MGVLPAALAPEEAGKQKPGANEPLRVFVRGGDRRVVILLQPGLTIQALKQRACARLLSPAMMASEGMSDDYVLKLASGLELTDTRTATDVCCQDEVVHLVPFRSGVARVPMAKPPVAKPSTPPARHLAQPGNSQPLTPTTNASSSPPTGGGSLSLPKVAEPKSPAPRPSPTVGVPPNRNLHFRMATNLLMDNETALTGAEDTAKENESTDAPTPHETAPAPVEKLARSTTLPRRWFPSIKAPTRLRRPSLPRRSHSMFVPSLGKGRGFASLLPMATNKSDSTQNGDADDAYDDEVQEVQVETAPEDFDSLALPGEMPQVSTSKIDLTEKWDFLAIVFSVAYETCACKRIGHNSNHLPPLR